MKTHSWLNDGILVVGLAAVMTIILAHPVYSQDTLKKNPKTTMKIKIIKEDHGKKTILDTTITSSKSIDQDEINEIIASLDDNMQGLDEGMKELNISLSQMKLPDSAMMDSINKMTKNIRIMISKNFGDRTARRHKSPGLFEYNFDFDYPEAPEPPEPPDAPLPGDGHHHHFEYRVAPHERFAPDMDRGDGSLMDLLRNIPMDQVKGFKIKEKKDGTRITIDVGHRPILGSPNTL